MTTITSPLSSTQVLFSSSEKGRGIARSILESQGTPGTAESADLFLSGLEKIAGDPGTSADEKTLAGIVMTVNVEEKGSLFSVDSSQAYHARFCALDAIAHAAPGPVSAVIARMALDSSGGVQHYPYKNEITTEALKAIGRHHGVSQEEQVYAGYAGTFTWSSLRVTMVEKIHRGALAALCAGSVIPGPASTICGTFALNTAEDLGWTAYGESVLHSGIKFFFEDQNSTAGQKALARSAFVQPRPIDAGQAVKKAFLRALVSPSTAPLSSRVAESTIDLAPQVPDDRSRQFLLFWALKSIHENPESPAFHTILAKDGMELDEKTMGTETLMNVRTALLKAIASSQLQPGSNDTEDVIRVLRADLAGTCDLGVFHLYDEVEDLVQAIVDAPPSSMEVDDSTIDIDGFRLGRNRE